MLTISAKSSTVDIQLASKKASELSPENFITASRRSQQTSKMDSIQKQPPRGVPRKRCSENMQQIYRRTPMPKCDFNKVTKQLY